MGSTILIYNRHSLKVFKYEIVVFGRHLYQFQRGEEFKKLWSPFPPREKERGLGAKGNTNLEVFSLSSSTH